MVDIAIAAGLVGVVIQGWRRGFVHELVVLVGVVAGAWAGIRWSGAAGGFLARWWVGMDAGMAALVGGALCFVVVGLVFVLLASRYADAGPENGWSRFGGVVAGLVSGWIVITAVATVLTFALVPMPTLLAESTILAQAASADQPAQVVLAAITGDRSLQAALGLQEVVGAPHVILEADETFPLEPMDDASLTRDQLLEVQLHDAVNDARLDAGQRRLTANLALGDVALAHAVEMATEGYIGHRNAAGLTVGRRVAGAGVPFRIAGENLALAPTVEIAHEGLLASEGHRTNLLDPDYTDIGIAVLDTPLGLIIVQVFTG